MKRTTIKDLAHHLGVHVSTVSRALKGHPDISPEMRRRVQQLAEQLHYTPNSIAIGLRQRRSRLVGLVIPEVNMFFFPSVIRGVDEVLRREGLKMMVLQSNNSLEQEIENLKICLESGVEGLLLSVSAATSDLQHLAELEEMDVPVVLFDRIVPTHHYDRVVIDDAAIAVQGVNYLISAGCNRIGGIFGHPNLAITRHRVSGFRQGVEQSGRVFDPGLVRYAGSPVEGARACLELLQSGKNEPDGLFLMSDELIAGASPAIRQAGKRIPEDCAVIGISDGFLPHYLFPKIPYLHHSGFEVGRIAANQLLRRIQGGDHQPPTALLVNTQIVPLHA